MNGRIVIRKKRYIDYQHLVEAGIDAFIAGLLYNRGISDIASAKKFLFGGVRDLYSPSLIRGIETAYKIVAKAIEEGKKIYVFGDYDVDGITATAILYLTLKDLGANVHFRLPDRLTEGYGMSTKAVEELAQNGCEVIIAVDNGIKCFEEVELAKNYGMEVVILDHHVPADRLPNADAVVDLHIPGETYPFKELAGCGLAFKFSCYLYDQMGYGEEGLKFIDLVAIGTIADSVPLVDENRILVKEGLNYINSPDYDRIGIIELMNSFGVTVGTLRASDIGYKIAPALNAPGRLRVRGADTALALLLCDDNDEAVDLAYQLFEINEERKLITSESVAKAELYIQNYGLADDKVIVLFVPDIPEGIVGLVAGKITEKYNRPSVVFSEGLHYYKASARSIEAFNLIESLKTCDDLFVKYGGHSLAAGMTIEKDQAVLEELRRRLNEYAEQFLTDEDLVPKIYVDEVLDEKDITYELIEKLDMLEPYGFGNPKPVFLVREYFTCKRQCTEGWVPYVYMGADKSHLKLFGTKTEAVGFGMAEKFEKLGQPRKLDIVFTLSVNNYKGNSTIQLEIVDFAPASASVQKTKTELMNALSDAVAELNSLKAR